MSSDLVFTAIRDFLTSNWAQTRLVFENEDATLPDNPAPYVLAEVSGNIYAPESIGAGSPDKNLWREKGILWLHVFVPSGTGSLQARQYATALVQLFKGLSLIGGALIFRDMSIGLGETADADGNYWRLSVTVDWQKDN